MRFILPFLISLWMVGCSTLDVNVDYDESFAFQDARSFYVEHETTKGESTLVNDRITNAIEKEIVQKGYKNQKADNALIFHFFYSAKDKTDLQTSYSFGGGFGRIGWGSRMMVSTTDTYEYTEGTLVVDVYNPKTKKIVWRSVGVFELQQQDTPSKKTAYINDIIQKMMQQYPSLISDKK